MPPPSPSLAADHRRAVGDLPEGAGAHLSLVGGDRRLCRHPGDAVAAFRSVALMRARRSDRRSAAHLRSAGAFCNAGSVIQTRRLTETETTSSIVFYFSLFCALAGLATWPFGWMMPTLARACGAGRRSACSAGSPHILLTESYRHAPASVVAPFDYTAMVWALLLGYLFFNEMPTHLRLRRRRHYRGSGAVRGVARAPARRVHRRAAPRHAMEEPVKRHNSCRRRESLPLRTP